MFQRAFAIALNTYREAVRARILHGLFALALATAGYALVVGAFALRNALRTVSDLGAASISIYGVVVTIVLGSTTLYRELELKTIFPILARPIRRSEYLVGKYLGIVLTLLVFICANSGVLLLAIAQMSGSSWVALLLAPAVFSLALLGLGWRVPRVRSYLLVPWALGILLFGVFGARGAVDELRVIVFSAALTACEVSIVAALTLVFSAFSTPFLTAVFTFGLFVVGRSADTLARLPARVFGPFIHELGALLSRVVPNLMFYVPPRALLTGETAQVSLRSYLFEGVVHALGWAAVLLGLASVLFRRKDFL